MFFRQRWKDSRLTYQPLPDKGINQRVILSPELSKYVWQPDLYFRNSKDARFHMVPTQNVLFGVSPDGSILLSARSAKRFWLGGNGCHVTRVQIKNSARTLSKFRLSWLSVMLFMYIINKKKHDFSCDFSCKIALSLRTRAILLFLKSFLALISTKLALEICMLLPMQTVLWHLTRGTFSPLEYFEVPSCVVRLFALCKNKNKR